MREPRTLHGEWILASILLVLARNDWIMQSLYHRNFSLPKIAAAIAVLASIPALLIGALRLLAAKYAAVPARVLVLLLAAYILQSPLRAAGLFGQTTIGGPQKVLILVVTVSIASVLAWSLTNRAWSRLGRALLTATLIFVLSPFVLVYVGAPDLNVTLRDVAMPAGQHQQEQQTIVLLLDEYSGARADTVVNALRQSGASVSLSRIKSAGDNTIDVVPQMFGAKKMTQVRQCTPTALCAPEVSIDFKRVHFVDAEHVHAVGMFHPYCVAKGLKSCTDEPSIDGSTLRDLACTFARLIPADRVTCQDPLGPQRWQAFRSAVLGSAFQSEFWRDGGALFLHVPLPHPPGERIGASLREEYQANLQLAADFTVDLWRRAQARWPGHVRMVVTSDHPLRTWLWCGNGRYKALGCDVPPDWTDGTVPLIIATSIASPSISPVSNAGLFASK